MDDSGNALFNVDGNTGTITVNLTDVNNNAPVLTVDNAIVNLAENPAIGAVVGTDADTSHTITGYSLTGTVLVDMLKAGQRPSAEIFAAAEGASISARTMQRVADALGVVKTKAGFGGGWVRELLAKGEGRADSVRSCGSTLI